MTSQGDSVVKLSIKPKLNEINIMVLKFQYLIKLSDLEYIYKNQMMLTRQTRNIFKPNILFYNENNKVVDFFQ